MDLTIHNQGIVVAFIFRMVEKKTEVIAVWWLAMACYLLLGGSFVAQCLFPPNTVIFFGLFQWPLYKYEVT